MRIDIARETETQEALRHWTLAGFDYMKVYLCFHHIT
jgi:hypothetical protein